MAQSKKKFLGILEKSLGVISNACTKSGVSRTTYYRWLKSDPKFKAQVDEIAEVAIDFAETSLLTQIKEGNPTSTIFYLKTKGRSRGYVEYVHNEFSLDKDSAGNIKIEIGLPDE